jgi:hypothetical protein
MTRRVLVLLSLAGLAACSGEPSQPSEPPGGPAFAIVDASDPGGRPDFGWRPPIGNTTLVGTFDGTRSPTVRICVLNASLDACVGADVFTATNIPVVNANYQVDWTVPVSPVVFYRIFVLAGSPAVILGYADVRTAATSKELKGNDPNQFVGITDGSILPIKFRTTDACDNANCGDGTIDTQQGGTVYYTEDGETKGGVTIPPTPGGGVVTVEITPCTGNLPIPNPKFGSCLDVLVEEGGDEYDGIGVAFICDALQAADDAGLNAAEKAKVTLYRKHGTDPVEALPHADDDCPEPEVIGTGSVKGLLRALVQGNWKKAGQQLTGILAPKPLYARRLDAGAGGSVDGGFSLFQFAQPCVAGVGANANNQAANAAFSSGDLDGAICRISEATFNGFVPSELRDLFPALIITWNSDPSLNADWATRLLPYLNLGGGVLFDGDSKNISDLATIVTPSDTSTGGEFGTFTVSATVTGLTDGITGAFENNHIRFGSWDSNLAPFLSFSPDGESTFTVGLYGTFGTGCIVLTGPDQDFHGLRASSDPEENNQYNLLLNELRFVQGGGNCVAPPILLNRTSPSGSSRIFGPESNRPVVRNPQVPPQQKTVKRPIN